MLKQLNDLEAAEGIRVCDNLITSFAFICMRTVTFSRHLSDKIQDIKNCKSTITLAKASSITIACACSILATYMCTDKLPLVMKGASSFSMWLDLIRSFSSNEWFPVKGSYGRELRIWDFLGSADVVRELKKKMARFASFTHQSEEEMMVVINKLEKMMDSILVAIVDMRRHAQLYSLDMREMGVALNQLLVDSNLQLSVTGVRLMSPNEEQQYENPVNEAMTIMYGATLSLILTDLQWYIHACEEEADGSIFLSCHSIIHDTTSRMIKIICYPGRIGEDSLDDIHKLITCLDAINEEVFSVLSECKEKWRHHPQLFHLVYDYHKICLQASQLYNDFVSLLKGQCDSRLSVILTLKEFVVSRKQDDDLRNYEEETLLHLNDDGRFALSGDFMKSFAYICKQTVAFTRHFNEEIQELKSVKALAKVSCGLIAGVFSVMAVYMVDCTPIRWMEAKTLTDVWLHLIRSFSWNSPRWKLEPLVIKEFFGIASTLGQAKYRMRVSSYAGKEDMMIVIDTAVKKIDNLSATFEEMSRHAHICSHDIIKAGLTLELASHNRMEEIG